MKKNIYLYNLIVMGLLVFTTVRAQSLDVKAYTDNTVIGLNQQFTLNVEISGKDLNAVSDPELPKMDAFAAFLGSGTSQSMQFINGKMSVSKTISYHFMATKVGKFQIDPVIVKAGGKEYRTDPISIEIQKTSTSTPPARTRPTQRQDTGPSEDDLFLKAIVNKKKVYQNEPVVVTYKIYTRVNVTSFGYTKLPTTAGFWVEEFPMSAQPQTKTEILEGKRYTVATIKKTALFPMTPGKKILDPLVIDCEVRVRSRSQDIFDDFFSDPFGRTIRKRVVATPVTIDVLPLPEEGKPADFTGVVGSYSMTSTIDKSSVKTNEAVSLTLKFEGKGNVRMLPEPDITFPTDFEVYPPKSSESINRKGSVITGSKTYEYVLVPRVPGVQKIKSVQLSIFDPSKKMYKTLKTDEIVIDVAKGKDAFVAAPTGLSKEEVRLVGQDIRFIKTALPSFRRIGSTTSRNMIFWAVTAFPLLCVAGAVLYRRHLDRIHGDVAYARDRRAHASARKRLSSARALMKKSTSKAFYAEVGKALTGFLADKLNIAEAGIISEEVQNILSKRGIDRQIIDDYFDCLGVCDLKRFSPSDTEEHEMKTFLHKAEKVIVQMQKVLSG
jgi:hypothetical protein